MTVQCSSDIPTFREGEGLDPTVCLRTLGGFVGGCGLMTLSETGGEGGIVSSEISESSPDDGVRPS